jgi:hypothetical protein
MNDHIKEFVTSAFGKMFIMAICFGAVPAYLLAMAVACMR